MSQTTDQPSGPFYIGIDFHKHYNVFCAIEPRDYVIIPNPAIELKLLP